jgi:excisionase family DNA binding protein
MSKKKSNSYNTSGTSPTFTLVLRPRGLRPPAAAAYLGTTSFHIEELMRSGELPFRIVGGARVIAVEDLDKYFDSLTPQAGKLAGRGVHIAKVAA